MAKRHWLIKSEPEAYSFDRLVEEGRTLWDGVRNYRAPRASTRSAALIRSTSFGLGP